MGRTNNRRANLDACLSDTTLLSDLQEIHAYAKKRRVVCSLPLLFAVCFLNAIFMFAFVAIGSPPPAVTPFMLVLGWVCSIPITFTFIALAKRRPRRPRAHWVQNH